MSAGTAAEVQERFERIIQGLASPLQQGDGRSSSVPAVRVGTSPRSGSFGGATTPGRPTGSGEFFEWSGPEGQPPVAPSYSAASDHHAASMEELRPSHAPWSFGQVHSDTAGRATPPQTHASLQAPLAPGPQGGGIGSSLHADSMAEQLPFHRSQEFGSVSAGQQPPQFATASSQFSIPFPRAQLGRPPALPTSIGVAGTDDPFLSPPTPPAAFAARGVPAAPPVLGRPPQEGAYPGGLFTPSGRVPDDMAPMISGSGGPGAWYGAGGGPEDPGDGPARFRKRRRSGGMLLDVEGTMRVFPAMFSFFCLATFSMPIWITYHIGNDENVKQWISTRIWLVLLLFIPYAVAHLIHHVKGHPVRLVLVTCLVGSSVVLLLIGDCVLLEAYKKANAFSAQDCDTFPGKRSMERELEEARAFYANCAAKKAAAFDLTFAQAVMQYRIQSCPEYADLVATKHPDWAYLGFLEDSYRCSGWCKEEEPMWTFAATSDSCSSAVADVLFNKIQWSTMQVVLYTIVVLGFVSTTLITIGPILIKLGIEW
uniref:Uncharacterized protein n=1 Tax=Alexandrium catenella TaxID=2925 RepID=A0A7S1WUW1_ALECA